ncbi:HAMP domain-containing histidine kinase [Salipaludibacillus agaradhaerens]|uniref:sensor histidine kinase n=1 Tax=Salipaludibacillus agaradhaerens TaxID=76935 RepID=UPI002150B7B9|nr:HAMP domain-containing sensor histidine kinase [Salipaludibacillus agaradhaerens]MCR6106174.1 HAMP domain-containing histidine kinase [Salipaludibacillus agaradhaerens]MCR6118207.1 HAMP domain-containing histidine kinase [Salipaludibacillus agaradhaerens]UJW57324.1 HAMP domain-containing histidine kinase [Bacillus sp. A116_S68]
MDKLENHVAKLLSDDKENIIKELSRLFNDIVESEEDEQCLNKQLSYLYDSYLNTIQSAEQCQKTLIYEYKMLQSIDNVGVMLSKVEKLRTVLVKKINSFPVTKVDKLAAIAILNELLLHLQKEIATSSDNKKHQELMSKRLQLSQLKQDRLDILSKLSTSFAHEIRNPLTSIKGFVQLLEQRLETIGEESKYFHYIYREMEEVEQQVDQILLLSTKKNHQDLSFKTFCLNQLLFNSVESFQPIITESHISLELELGDRAYIYGIKNQIKLVLNKLLQNALDALLLKDKDRKLIIRLTNEVNWLKIEFFNNGPPVSRMVEQSMFEPFVGTKELGKGLGLAVSKQLMRKHEGDICYIREQEWTVFKLLFPKDHHSQKNIY